MVPHEYAHSWNGKFRRPRDLWAPDFNTPTGNSLLWVYEGQTQYWARCSPPARGCTRPTRRASGSPTAPPGSRGHPGRAWRSLQDTAYDAISIGRQQPLDWSSWQRNEDYYEEGSLLWLDADTRIRELSGGARSLDDFALAFFGVEEGRVAPLLYDFQEVVGTLGRVQPFDWSKLLKSQVDDINAAGALDGLARAGWRLAWTDQQGEYAKSSDDYFEATDLRYSLGIRVDRRGQIVQVIWDSPAFRAGLARGPTLVAVNLREYKPDVLRAAIGAAKAGPEPIDLLVKDGSQYRQIRVDYRGGLRYPKLERIEGTKDWLTAILAPR
jgi:predicted metalloprotease with PDZ domain